MDKQSFNDIKKKALQTDSIEMEQSNFKYRAHKGRLRDDATITEPFIQRLNFKYLSLFKKSAPTRNLSSTQFIVKSFVPNESYYDLHKEDPKIYGESAFMYYLTEEIDGDLSLPAFDFKLTPMENLCVIMRTDILHKVDKCSGSRLCITGWSFAPSNRLTKNSLKGYERI